MINYGRNCNKCGEHLTSENTTQRRIDTYHYTCGKCLKKSPGRQRRRKRAIEKIRRMKEHAFNILGRKCVMCGNEDIRVLCFDHIGGGGKTEREETGKYSYQIIWTISPEEARERFQVLCRNCNWIKAHEKDEFENCRSD